MKQFRIVSVVMFCVLFAFSSSGLAMSSKKVSGGSRDVASERDIASFEHESKGVPQLITYEELKSLSPERRAEYIAGVRAMIVELAAKGGKDFPMFASGKSLEETYSLLEALLPAAYAQEFNNPGDDPMKIYPRYLGRKWYTNAENWDCGSSSYYHEPSVGTCVNKKVGKMSNVAVSCPAHHYDAYMKNAPLARIVAPTHKYCVPKLSWEKYLAPSRRTELANKEGATSVASAFATRMLGGQEGQIGAEITLGAARNKNKLVPAHLAVPVKDEMRGGYTCLAAGDKVKYDSDLGTCGDAVGQNENCQAGGFTKVYIVKESWGKVRKFFCVPPASWNNLSEARQTALQFPVGYNAATASEREQAATGKGRRTYASVTVSLPPAAPAPSKEAAPNDNPETPVVERSEGESIATGGAPCAGISQVTCGDASQKSEKRKAASDWWKKNSNVCVFAGNISNFSSKENKEKTCASVYSFSKPKLNCKEGVICNPIVFGVAADGSELCTTNYAQATEDCNARAGEKGKNDWLEKNISSVKNEWNKLRDGLSQACGLNAVRDYFCAECNIIMERLASLKLLALNRNSEGVCQAPMVSYETKAGKPEAQPEQKAKQ